ncbi:hypothetical protein [Paenibacillus lutrae]|uniref:Uncharacterized protein n=1 Tax=Paenibacillus lutrae TaxID=2078573 RepID=A0A7X3FLV6_9BACL|nr:hypothetical protein [Paenibacillus lutrae]MVP02111.1 hypothetical protein [Paenibacillus lutrae]
MIEEKPVQVIGDKVTAKYKSFFDEQGKGIHSAWIPMIEVDGKMMGIHDESTISGQKESSSRHHALKIARRVSDDTKARLAEKITNTGE